MADAFRLVTPRTLIRSVAAADLATLYAIATRPEVARMLFLFAPDMGRAAFDAIFPPGAQVPPFRAAIERNGRVIGSIGIGAGATPPVYYFLAPEAAGQGLATEVVGAFAAEMVARHASAALTAEVFADNPASCRVLEKCGFARVEARRLWSAARPAPAPGWLFRRSGAPGL